MRAAALSLVCHRPMYLWRAVDAEGEVLDMLVQSRRGTAAALLRCCC